MHQGITEQHTEEEMASFTSTSDEIHSNSANPVKVNDSTALSFCNRLRSDVEYRKNYILTLNLISSHFILGWMMGQTGPAFLDLQLITNVTLERGSAFFTAAAVGYLFGTVLMGIVYNKIDTKVFFIFIAVCGISLTTVIIPWCSSFEVMIFVQLLKGIFCGILDTSGNTLLSRTWGSDGRMFMQSLHFGYALGGTISPLAIAPFLTPERQKTLLYNNTVTPHENTSTIHDLNDTSENMIHGSDSVYITNGDSILYVGFSISAALAFTCAIPLFIIFLQNVQCSGKTLKPEGEKETDENDTNLTDSAENEKNFKEIKTTENRYMLMKTIVIIVLTSILVLDCSIEVTFMSFLSTFCVRQLQWTKTKGALINSAFWGAFAFGRLSAIILVIFVPPVTLIFLFASVELLSFSGIFVSSWLNWHIGMWIFTPLLGFSVSAIFPTIFTWTEESFLKVTVRISSLFLFGACCGSSINPIILGKIMDQYSDMCFVYLLSGEAVVFYFTLFLALFISKRIVGPRKHCVDTVITSKSDCDENDPMTCNI